MVCLKLLLSIFLIIKVFGVGGKIFFKKLYKCKEKVVNLHAQKSKELIINHFLGGKPYS